MTWIDTHIHIWTQDTKRYSGTDLEDFEPKEFILGLFDEPINL